MDINKLFASQLASVKPISHWLSGESAFDALSEAVDELVRTAPEDHDVIVKAFNLTVREIRYVEPHALIFRGFDEKGNDSTVVCHYSNLLAHVIYIPKSGPERIITGFARQ